MLIAFAGYFLVLLGISYFSYKKTTHVEDYLLAGRRLGPWTSAFSAAASDMSGWLLLGLPGYAYLSGFESFWLALGLLVGSWLNWQWIAKPLRIETEKLQAITIPDYLAKKFNDESGQLKLIAAVLILFFYLFYTSSGLVAAGKLFEAVFSVPYPVAVLVGMAVVAVYTSFGGYLAVCWTDLFQGLLMFIALLLLCAFSLYSIGGFLALQHAIELKQNHSFSLFINWNREPVALLSIISLLAWGLGYFGQPHILCRFMSIRSDSQIPKSRMIAVCWSGLCLFFAITLGITAHFILPTELIPAASETVLLELIPLLLNPFMAGICLSAILAAIMSTVDSQLLITASSFTQDLIPALKKQTAQNNQHTLSSRLIVIICAVIASIIALESDSSVLSLVSYAWGGFGAVLGPLIILSLYSKHITKTAAIAGMLSGGISIVVFKQLSGGWLDIYELLPAFIISTITLLIVSYVTRHTLD